MEVGAGKGGGAAKGGGRTRRKEGAADFAEPRSVDPSAGTAAVLLALVLAEVRIG